MLTLFCTILGYVIVASAIGFAGVFVIAALVFGFIEIFSKKNNKMLNMYDNLIHKVHLRK